VAPLTAAPARGRVGRFHAPARQQARPGHPSWAPPEPNVQLFSGRAP